MWTQTLALIRQAFEEENMNRTMKVETHRDRRMRDSWKVKCILNTFFDIKGIVHEEFVLAGQSVNSAYCCDVA
jgi:hypothetical protein